jgi:hypothetical protein
VVAIPAPEARNKLARSVRAGKADRHEIERRRCDTPPSETPGLVAVSARSNVFGIVRNVVLFQKGKQFGGEIHATVVGLLSVDVTDYCRKQRVADAEGRVVFLPGEFRAVLSHPARGIGFDGADGFGEWGVTRNLNQQVKMVGGASDSVAEGFLILADADDVAPELRPKRYRNGRRPIFGGENNVDDVLNVSVGHNGVSR